MVMSVPKVSVIVLIYKVERYIERCARSLFCQTMQDIEYIFVNDCTPDDSMKILQSVMDEYPFRTPYIKIISHEKNMGSGLARNTGLSAATAPYVIYCDGDDWVESDMYEKLYIKACTDDADIVMCDYYEEIQGRRIRYSQNPYRHKEDVLEQMLVGKLHSSVCGALIRKNLYVENHIQFPVGISMWEDLCTSVRLHYFARRVSYVEEAFYHYMIYNDSVSHRVTAKQLNDMVDACMLIGSFLKELNIHSSYRISFLRRCFYAKKHYLVDTNLRNFSLWRNLWPESNVCLKAFHVRFYHRLGYHLANLGYYRIAVVILRICDRMDDGIKRLIGRK